MATYSKVVIWYLVILNAMFLHEVRTNWLPYTVLEHGPVDLTVIAGETARFSCDLNLPARHDVIWWLFEASGCFLYISRNEMIRQTCGINMNHYRIDVDVIHHIYTIEIDNASEDDAGTYICKNESSVLASAKLVVLPRNPDPTPVTPAQGVCATGVCCDVSYYPTGLAPSSEMEAQATCRWPVKYNDINIHVHLFCDGREIRGADKVLLADRAIGKIEPSLHTGCSNFTCNLEIVGERDIKDSCTIHADNALSEVVVKVEPEISFVEEGLNAIFFCHVSNTLPTSGSFQWYIVHTHYMSVNSISSQPIASTTGYYGKLELSAVRLDDDFMTIQCFFEPDSGGNYSTKSNPAVLRVLRRSSTHISCYTGEKSSLLECTDGTDDAGTGGENKEGFQIWPLSIKEWILIGTIFLLIIIIIFLVRPALRKPANHRRSLDQRSRHYQESDLDATDTANQVNQPGVIHTRGRYEYLAERYYDAPYSLLRNIRNFPRRLRHRVIQRHYARNARQARQCEANHSGSPSLTYGSIDPTTGQAVRLRDRVSSRPSETTQLSDISPRQSSDYDVLDASTMNVFHPSPPSSPRDVSIPASRSENAMSSTAEELSECPSSPTNPCNGPTLAKKPKVAPRPLSSKPSTAALATRIPSISADVDDRLEYGGDEPSYVNLNDGYTSPLASPINTQPQPRMGNDGYLQPIQERTDYQSIC